MGQCAPSSTPYYSPYSRDDEEFSFASHAGAYRCNVGIGIPVPHNHKASSQNGLGKNVDHRQRNDDAHQGFDHNSSLNDTRINFLQVHQSDIPQRCIVDQSEVKRVVWLQIDELLRRRGQLKMHGTFVDQRASKNIRLANRNQEDVGTIDKEFGACDQKSLFGECSDHEGGTPSILSEFTSASNATVVRTNTKQRNQKALDTNDVAMAGTVNTPLLVRSSFSTCLTNQRDSRLNRCPSVLRLKMKANFGRFYSQCYLMMFPDRPKPIVGRAARKEGEIPDLTCESSESSFTSSYNSYNDHIYCSDHGSIPPTKPIKCSVTSEPFLDLAIMGCLGLVPRKQDRNSLRSSRRQLKHPCEKSPDHYVVLINKRSGTPLAVCALKATSGSPVVRIYATRQRAYAQKPTATTQQLGLDWAKDLPLFAWAEIISEGDFPNKVKFTAYIAERSEGCFSSKASYEATFDGSDNGANSAVRSPVIKIMGRTDNERTLSGCAIISIQADETTPATPKNISDVSFRIDIARGIDPAFLICFTAIIDEVLEKSMRVKCKNRIRRRVRKDSFSLTKERLDTCSR